LLVARWYSIFHPKLKWISLLVALESAIIFIKKVCASAIWDSFIFDFLVGILIVIVTIL
jgi:hypothetical protein